MTESNINNLIRLADAHPGLATLVVIMMVLLLVLIGVGLYFLVTKIVKHLKIKKGNLEIDTTEMSSKKESGNANYFKNDTHFLKCVAALIDASVDSGFQRSVKRQDLFNRQMQFAHTRYQILESEIVNEYVSKRGVGAIKIIEMIVKHVFSQCVYNKLEKIFKEDHLTDNTKDKVVETNRYLIDSMISSIISEIKGLSAATSTREDKTISYIDEELVKIIENKTDLVKKATIDIIERGFDIAVEEMQKMHALQKSLTEKVNNILGQYLENTEKLPSIWNDDLPPNEIIGDL